MEKFFKYPLLIVGIIGIITVFFALQIPRAQLDNNNLRFVPEQDEARRVSAYIDDTFGSSLFVLVGLERKYGTVFDGEFLDRVRRYTERIETMEIVGAVNSMVTSDYITGSGDTILVEPLIPADFTGTGEEITELKRRLLSWDMYRRSLVSDDFSSTQILIPLEIAGEDAGQPEAIDSFVHIRDIAREMFEGLAEVYVTGLPVISAAINEAVNADLLLLVPLVIVVVLAVLFFSFRRFTAVVLPLLTVLIAVIWSMGAMPLFNVKLSVISTVLPVILIAVGSAYGIHVVTHYLEEGEGGFPGPEEHRVFIFTLMKKIGKPIFLAALTTFVGFSSFCFTSVLPIREFGFFSAFGVLVSFVVALTLIPSLFLLRGPKPFRAKNAKVRGDSFAGDPLNNVIADFFGGIVRKKWSVLFLTLAATAISIYGVSKLVIDNVFVEYFKSATDISRSDKFIREKFGGSKVVSVVLEAESPEILLRPESLKAMENLNRYLEARVPEVGKVMGFTDLIKRINQVFNVDESPEGIKRSLRAGTEDEGGEDFGFGDFGGFDDFGDFDETLEDNRIVGDVSGTGSPAAVYTQEELITLFNRALSSLDKRPADADELVRQLERLVNYEGLSYYEIPEDPGRYGKTRPEELQQLVSNYLILLSGDITSYANDPLEPTAIKTTIQLRTVGQTDTDGVVNNIYRYAEANFPDNLRLTVGGSALVESSLNRLVVQSQLSSVIISLLMVFLIISLSNRSVIAGLIGIAPLSISILINFAVMGFLGIKLNIGTSMVASVSVGIGIDYTIHYIEAFKREYHAAGGGGDFLRRTFTTSGKAIIINALSVGAGFAVLLLSRFVMLEHLGLLIALTMGISALVSMTVIPVLLLFFNPQFIRREL
ncbi:MAG: MMPL family transporter [Treponema sp.]|jgi:predicted RND superfamily exporter protein|nr:MMPL family transporter [Treponema sp.]